MYEHTDYPRGHGASSAFGPALEVANASRSSEASGEAGMNCVMDERTPGLGDAEFGLGARGSTLLGSTVCSVMAMLAAACRRRALRPTDPTDYGWVRRARCGDMLFGATASVSVKDVRSSTSQSAGDGACVGLRGLEIARAMSRHASMCE